jgi:hypothetical protein
MSAGGESKGLEVLGVHGRGCIRFLLRLWWIAKRGWHQYVRGAARSRRDGWGWSGLAIIGKKNPRSIYQTILTSDPACLSGFHGNTLFCGLSSLPFAIWHATLQTVLTSPLPV